MPGLEPYWSHADESDSYSDDESAPGNDEIADNKDPGSTLYKYAKGNILAETRDVIHGNERKLDRQRQRYFGRQQLIDLAIEVDSSEDQNFEEDNGSESEDDDSNEDEPPELIDRIEDDSSDNDEEEIYKN